MKYADLHYGQIPTSYKAVKDELCKSGISAIHSLLKCFTCKTNSNRYINLVVLTAAYFERISCLVYKSGGSYKKLSEKRYKKAIFEDFAESPQEIFERVQNITADKAERIHKTVWQIADIVCPMMACISEQAFLSEYAYAIDYVIKHKGNLPKAEIGILFPENYDDYHYWSGMLVQKIKTYIE